MDERFVCVQKDCWILHNPQNPWRTIEKMRVHGEAMGHKGWMVHGKRMSLKKAEIVLLKRGVK